MRFEEAIANLRNKKILTRVVWNGKQIEFANNQLNLITKKPSSMLKEKWNPDHEDIVAQDWTIVDPDDVKEFSLSVNQLKALGVEQTKIDKLKGSFKNLLPEHVADLIDVNEFLKK
jgi:hypothetical protein